MRIEFITLCGFLLQHVSSLLGVFIKTVNTSLGDSTLADYQTVPTCYLFISQSPMRRPLLSLSMPQVHRPYSFFSVLRHIPMQHECENPHEDEFLCDDKHDADATQVRHFPIFSFLFLFHYPTPALNRDTKWAHHNDDT